MAVPHGPILATIRCVRDQVQWKPGKDHQHNAAAWCSSATQAYSHPSYHRRGRMRTIPGLMTVNACSNSIP